MHLGSETNFWFFYLSGAFVAIDNKADFDFDFDFDMYTSKKTLLKTLL